jgi:hypothetical protein
MRLWRLWRPRKLECDQEAATQAVEHAARSVEVAEGRAEVVAELTSSLRQQGITNNFVSRLNMHVARKETP